MSKNTLRRIKNWGMGGTAPLEGIDEHGHHIYVAKALEDTTYIVYVSPGSEFDIMNSIQTRYFRKQSEARAWVKAGHPVTRAVAVYNENDITFTCPAGHYIDTIHREIHYAPGYNVHNWYALQVIHDYNRGVETEFDRAARDCVRCIHE